MILRTLTSSLASAALPLRRNGPDSKPLRCVKSSRSVRKSSRSGSGLLPTPGYHDAHIGYQDRSKKGGQENVETVLRNTLSSSPTSETLTALDSEEQYSSRQGCLVNLLRLPGSEKERKMTVGSGQRLLEYFPRSDRLGPFLKTLLESLVLSEAWYSRNCLLKWKPKATKYGRLLFQLAPSTPRTGGTGSGSLHTPRTTPRSINYLLKTPSSVETEGGVMEIRPGCDGHYKLRDQIAMLPTLVARDYRGMFAENSEAYRARLDHPRGVNLVEELQRTNNGKNRGLKLQPAFVEWMMGFPDGWTDLKHSATQSSRKSLTKSSRQSQKLKEED